MNKKKKLLWAAGGAAVLLVGVQFIPYGRDHTNPPVISEPEWDSPSTRQLAVRACFDCHSYETEWPWYASVAPMSWVVQSHVEEGREELNFSDWGRKYEEAAEAPELVLQGEMPLKGFLLLHPEARLDQSERRTLASGLKATIGGEAIGKQASLEER